MADKERLIDAELLTTNIAQIAKNCARSDAQKALIGRILYMIENMPTIEEEALPLQVVTSEYMLQGYLVSDDYFVCPSCSYKFGKTEDVMEKEHLLELFIELNFCPKCGQRLMRNDDGNLCYRRGKDEINQ